MEYEKVKCPKCGAEVDAGTKFCPNCGTNLQKFQQKVQRKQEKRIRLNSVKKKPIVLCLIAILAVICIVAFISNLQGSTEVFENRSNGTIKNVAWFSDINNLKSKVRGVKQSDDSNDLSGYDQITSSDRFGGYEYDDVYFVRMKNTYGLDGVDEQVSFFFDEGQQDVKKLVASTVSFSKDDESNVTKSDLRTHIESELDNKYKRYTKNVWQSQHARFELVDNGSKYVNSLIVVSTPLLSNKNMVIGKDGQPLDFEWKYYVIKVKEILEKKNYKYTETEYDYLFEKKLGNFMDIPGLNVTVCFTGTDTGAPGKDTIMDCTLCFNVDADKCPYNTESALYRAMEGISNYFGQEFTGIQGENNLKVNLTYDTESYDPDAGLSYSDPNSEYAVPCDFYITLFSKE